jgi:hypothetical protein
MEVATGSGCPASLGRDQCDDPPSFSPLLLGDRIRDAKLELHLLTGEDYLGAFHAYL